MKNVVRQNFAMWNDALLTRDPKKVAELYTPDCTFLPTVSGEFKKGHSGAEAYFRHFLEKNPNGVIVDDEVQELGSDCYLHSGIYNFEVGPDNNRSVVEARFSYVWKKDKKGDWRIAHHHSSLRPK
ncbi:MAG: SgcJ/EcaC family oxidoreductase [Patescibacteria group bacterium]